MKQENTDDVKPAPGLIFIEEKPERPYPKYPESLKKVLGTTEKLASSPGHAAPTKDIKPIEKLPPQPTTGDTIAEILKTLKVIQENQKFHIQQMKTISRELSSLRRDIDSLLPERTQTVVDLDEWTERKPAVWQQKTMNEFFKVIEPPPPKPLPPILVAFSHPVTVTPAVTPRQSQKLDTSAQPQRPFAATPVKRDIQTARSTPKTISKKRALTTTRTVLPPNVTETSISLPPAGGQRITISLDSAPSHG